MGSGPNRRRARLEMGSEAAGLQDAVGSERGVAGACAGAVSMASQRPRLDGKGNLLKTSDVIDGFAVTDQKETHGA
jgi:hypothetical protein